MLQYSIDLNNHQTGNASVNHLYAVKKTAGLRELINHHKEYLLLKRGIDITLSLAVTVFLLSWLVPLIGLLIKLDSRGPVLFVQKRIGRYGKPFWCLKFRTMVLNTESDQKAAVENDSRITRVGRFLRLSNIDEFPQFMNVLTGSMSIVGPRPHMLTDCGKFSAIQPGYKFRNLVKPGLTGLAQVKGYHGPARSIESITLRFFWDKQYIYRFSLLLDIKIILQTILQYLGALFSPGISKSSVPTHFWHHS
jgi:putative colanic acid biosynthesis UDP-glucose lipid carrier transferase